MQAGGTLSSAAAKKKAMFQQKINTEGEGKAAYTVKKPTDALLSTAEAIRKSHPHNLAAKFTTPDYFNSLTEPQQKEFMQIVSSGINNPDSTMGCYAMKPTDYDTYKPFFSKVLAGYHNVAEDAKHVNTWDLSTVDGLPEGGTLNLFELGLPPTSMRVRVGRNLADFPLPGAMHEYQRKAMETKMTAAFQNLIANEKFGGAYYSLTPGHPNEIDDDKYNELIKAHIMFKNMANDSFLVDAGIAKHWPHGRGCYVSEDKQVIVWVGEEDHLRIMCMKKGAILNQVFDRLKEVLDTIESIDGINFAVSPDYGCVTSCPTNLGTGMRASVLMQLPRLTADGTDKKAKAVCKPLGLGVRGLGGEHTPIGPDGTCDISPTSRFIITEAQIIKALYDGIKLLKEKEDA